MGCEFFANYSRFAESTLIVSRNDNKRNIERVLSCLELEIAAWFPLYDFL